MKSGSNLIDCWGGMRDNKNVSPPHYFVLKPRQLKIQVISDGTGSKNTKFWKPLTFIQKTILTSRPRAYKGKGKAVPLHAMEALGGRGGIAPTHSRPRH
jgi:hypothetical protein